MRRCLGHCLDCCTEFTIMYNEASEHVTPSLTLARVMATFSLAASASRVPVETFALDRTNESRITGLSLPWHLSIVSTSTPLVSLEALLPAAAAAAGAGVLLPLLLDCAVAAASTSFCKWLTCHNINRTASNRALIGAMQSNCFTSSKHAMYKHN